MADDHDERCQAVRFAIANTRIAGGSMTLETGAIMAAWVRGETDSDELDRRGLELYGRYPD